MIYLLHQALDASAEKYPAHPALRFQGQSLTYRELSEKSNQLAYFLREQGIDRRDRVGIFLNKSLETVIAIYGILKAGAAYVPLDPQSPVSRLEAIIRDCGIKGIISENSKRKTLQQVGALATSLEFVIGISGSDVDPADMGFRAYDWEAIAVYPAESAPDLTILENDLAYIMYTSGSTGQPKGMMHTHASGMNYSRMAAALYDVTHDDILSNFPPLHFDQSTFDYLTSMMCGATTVIIPEAYTLFPANLSKLIEDERMTIWYSVPFALIQLLHKGVLAQRDLSSLRWILYGGEAFPRATLKALLAFLPNAQVSNVYGPAEVNQCTYYHLPPPTDWTDDEAPIPIGVMVDNAEGLVIDEDDTVLGVGDIGELVVRTPTMMRGYWSRPDLNATAFYKRQIFPDYEDIFYRTGDLVQLREDGLYDFLGRKDHQIKVRGYRVELAELDHLLNNHEAITEGAAYALRDDAGDRIEAAVIMATEKALTERDIIGYLSQNLPQYAVPQRVVFMANFPRTSTNKVDRRALADMAKKRTS